MSSAVPMMLSPAPPLRACRSWRSVEPGGPALAKWSRVPWLLLVLSSGSGRVQVELLEVDHGQVGDGVQLAVDVALREFPARCPELVRLGPGAHHGGLEDEQHLDVVGVPAGRGRLGADGVPVGLHAVRAAGQGNGNVRVAAGERLAPRRRPGLHQHRLLRQRRRVQRAADLEELAARGGWAGPWCGPRRCRPGCPPRWRPVPSCARASAPRPRIPPPSRTGGRARSAGPGRSSARQGRCRRSPRSSPAARWRSAAAWPAAGPP